ncbi:amidase signature domain-containing protein [Xylogone sp. PMI_703]|nr:amidase signature domain-containing protein [Xylogone sp. PMI_703]
MVSPEWQELIDKKRAARDALIPTEWRIPPNILSKVSPKAELSAFELLEESKALNARDIEITTQYDASALLNMLASGRISSLEVTKAFCKRAIVAQQLTNCLTEIFVDSALERAQYLDEYFAREGKPIGPFHGLPISLKDILMVKEQFATLGFISYLKKPAAEENSVLVDILLDAGAVLYVKTNVPQTLFLCEGYNNVFGQTLNPHKLLLTPGGSTSGEGALIALRGSVMGVGTDIAGSIRAPSLCNGIFGFKPSSDRIPWARQQELIPKGWPSIVPALGPHATSARDLTLFFKTIIQSKPWLRDSTAYAIPWREVPTKTRLNIGVFVSDPDIPVFPPVSRIINSAAQKLEEAGHNVVVIDRTPSIRKATLIAARSFALDTDSGSQVLAEAGEEPIPELSDANAGKYIEQRDPTLADVWSINADKEEYREEWAQAWREHELDVLLCPGSRATAVPHGQYGVPEYTLVWNLLDFPASVIPYLRADKSIDHQQMDGYDAAAVDGAPGSVQIVGWRFQDEEVLMATEVIAEVLAR